MFRFIPLIDSLYGYSKSKWQGDWSAGLTVGVLLIPQGMAYALIAGIPPEYGLYTAIAPTIIYALFGTCRQLAVGPVAMDSLLVAAGVSTIALSGTSAYLVLVILLTLMVGSIQVLMGIARLGFIVSFLSKPVIYGFTFAAALIIAFNQVKYLIGISIDRSQHITEIVRLLYHQSSTYNSATLLVSLVSIAIILLSKKFAKRVPGSLLGVGIGIFMSYWLDLAQYGVSTVGAIPQGLPHWQVPALSMGDVRTLLVIAIILALVGFMEAYSLGKSLQGKHDKEYEINANKELMSIGMGNILGAFFSTMPATGGFSRSAVNQSAGARTGVASLISAVVVIFTLLFLTPVFYYLPHAVLGAVIVVAVLKLIDFKQVMFLWKCDRYDFFILLCSFVGTILLGIEIGILLGIMLSLLVLIYKTSNPHMAVLGRVEGTRFFRNINRFKNIADDQSIAVLRFDAGLFFANADALKTQVKRMVNAKPSIDTFILDGQSMNDIDATGLTQLDNIHEFLVDQKIAFYLVSLIGPVRDKLVTSGLVDQIGRTNIKNTIEEVLDDDTTGKLLFQTDVG